MYGLKNGEYYNHMMCLDQSRVRKALIVVYSNDYLTLIQYLKKKMKKMFMWQQNTNRQICGFRFKLPIFRFDSTQTVAAWSADFYSFIYL